MELRINDYQLPQPIEFNYDEILAWVQERTEVYKNMIYDDTQISQAKNDRADLRRVAKALNDRRITLEREYTQPLAEFKEKINTLIKCINEPADLIDQRIKEFEKMKRDEKAEAIAEMFDGIEDKPDWVELGMIWDKKWLNTTKSMKSIREEITAALDGIKKDLATLAEIRDFGFEATEEYKRTLDINKALAEGMRLAEIQKRKEAEAKARAEEEARRAEAERQAKLDSILHNPTSQIINAAEAREEAERQGIAYMNPPELEPMHEITEPFPGGPVERMEMPSWVRFEACMTTQQALALKSFFQANNIEFRQI